MGRGEEMHGAGAEGASAESHALPTVKQLQQAFNDRYADAGMPPKDSLEMFASIVGQVGVAQDIMNRGEFAVSANGMAGAVLGRAAAMLQELGFDAAAEHVMQQIDVLEKTPRSRGVVGFNGRN